MDWSDDANAERPMRVVLVRKADGARREYKPDWKPSWTGADHFWWTDGNFGCDCNRALSWARAGDEDDTEETPCGDALFDVEFSDATAQP